MKTVLVTGCAGFIASHVSEILLKRGDAVIGIDDLNDYYPVKYKEKNVALLKDFNSFQFVKGSIVDRPTIDEIFEKNDITHVAHIAARAGVRPSLADPLLYEEVNVRGTLNLLEASRKRGAKNFVITSSSSVYGNTGQVPSREDDSSTDRPISPYAATKKACEVLGHTYHHLYGMNVNVIRPFNVYGPRGRPDMAPWLFLESALKRKPIRKFGDGSLRRAHTFIGDFAPGFVNAIDREFGYEIFNLGNSAMVTLNEFLSIVEELVGQPLIIQQDSVQPGDVNVTNADISKARKMLSYDPKTSFRDGMKVFFDWFKENVQI